MHEAITLRLERYWTHADTYTGRFADISRSAIKYLSRWRQIRHSCNIT